MGLWGATDGKHAFQPLMAQGTFLDEAVTSFAAEAIALDEATEHLKEVIRMSMP